MGWVMEKLAKGKPVYGVIVAGEISENLKYAILAIPNVRLFEYQISFTLKPIAHAVSLTTQPANSVGAPHDNPDHAPVRMVSLGVLVQF